MKKFFKNFIKAITSRYFLSSIFIILEVAILIVLDAFLINYFIYYLIFAYVVSFIIYIYIVNMDSLPENKIIWISIILFLPPFGAVLYIIFGRRFVSLKEKKFFKLLSNNTDAYSSSQNDSSQELRNVDRNAYNIIHALEVESKFYLNKNTKCSYFSLGDYFFPDLITSLQSAKKFIFIETFIVCPGYMWNTVLDILIKKIQEGVEVRFLYDDIGSFLNVSDHYYRKLRQLGINAACFGKYTGKANSCHNNRLHRKIIIIDGVTAYTGGVNLADEYINKKERFGHWKDSVIRIDGQAVINFINLFLFDWDMSVSKISDNKNYINNDLIYQNERGYYLPFGDGPRPFYQTRIANNLLLNLINQSKEYIYITTPYLIIDHELINSLINAARRSVEVVIITPHIPDKKIIYMMTKSSYMSLIQAGVKIYEYTPGFIHSKNIISDDKFAVCGTINFDYRSLVHHYEDGVLMYDSPAIFSMKEDFLNTIGISSIQTIKNARLNFFEKTFICLLKVFAPLL